MLQIGTISDVRFARRLTVGEFFALSGWLISNGQPLLTQASLFDSSEFALSLCLMMVSALSNLTSADVVEALVFSLMPCCSTNAGPVSSDKNSSTAVSDSTRPSASTRSYPVSVDGTEGRVRVA